ncbi:hypothetical protein BYT27DRAFT_7263108 [Phlegmacium glaucopus]|nr:hypothetical protein BYT27DRAFT_7263108 [Phlegmacium glaucopus]
MTRVTDFGLKRTYLEAGFSNDETSSKKTALVEQSTVGIHDPTASSEAAPPPKKKRKRTPKSKRDGNLGKDTTENKGEARENDSLTRDTEEVLAQNSTATQAAASGKSAKRNKRNKERLISDSEARRRKRINQKLVETTCFACREKGHAAKDCPTTRKYTEDGDGEKGTNAVGICYRCGSKRHSLSRCKKPSNPADPYPFALCFVCKGKGHLASACLQNKSKGVYPNGGSCKLCGDTSHLAKDCGIRQKVADPTTMLGTGREAGPDEDDFHTFKRRTTEVDRDEKQASKTKQMLELRAGAHSGVIKAFGNVPSTMAKKVVVFK